MTAPRFENAANRVTRFRTGQLGHNADSPAGGATTPCRPAAIIASRSRRTDRKPAIRAVLTIPPRGDSTHRPHTWRV